MTQQAQAGKDPVIGGIQQHCWCLQVSEVVLPWGGAWPEPSCSSSSACGALPVPIRQPLVETPEASVTALWASDVDGGHVSTRQMACSHVGAQILWVSIQKCVCKACCARLSGLAWGRLLAVSVPSVCGPALDLTDCLQGLQMASWQRMAQAAASTQLAKKLALLQISALGTL